MVSISYVIANLDLNQSLFSEGSLPQNSPSSHPDTEL